MRVSMELTILFCLFIKIFIYLFIFGCIGSWLQCMGFSLLVAPELSSCSTWAPECMGSVVAACGLSSCGVLAQLPHSMCDLSSPTRDRTRVPCIGRWILNHWTTREIPQLPFMLMSYTTTEHLSKLRN